MLFWNLFDVYSGKNTRAGVVALVFGSWEQHSKMVFSEPLSCLTPSTLPARNRSQSKDPYPKTYSWSLNTWTTTSRAYSKPPKYAYPMIISNPGLTNSSSAFITCTSTTSSTGTSNRPIYSLAKMESSKLPIGDWRGVGRPT